MQYCRPSNLRRLLQGDVRHQQACGNTRQCVEQKVGSCSMQWSAADGTHTPLNSQCMLMALAQPSRSQSSPEAPASLAWRQNLSRPRAMMGL